MSAAATTGKSGNKVVTAAVAWILVFGAIMVIGTIFLGPHRSYQVRENLANGMVEATLPEFARAADGLPIVDGSRQRQPFPIPAFESVSFYVVGDDVQIYYGHCYAEVLPATMLATAEDYLLGIGHIRPTSAQQMTKVTVISSDAHGCGT